MAYTVVVPETVSTKKNDAPSYQYELDFEPGTRNKTSIVIKYKIWGRIYGNGSYDGTEAMTAWPYANGKYPSGGIILRPAWTTWYKPTWHSVTGSFTIYNISMGTTSISTALEVTKGGGKTNGTLSKTAGKSFSIPAWPSYKITYDANGGTGAPATGKKWKDEVYTVPSTKPTKSGYVFVDWIINTGYHVKAGNNISAGSNSNYILTANWAPSTYKISYNANGGTGAPDAQTKNYGTNLTLSSTKPTRVGYKFLGWNTSKTDTSAKYSAGGTYTDNIAVTLYAIWEELTYSITCIANGGKINNDDKKILTKKYFTDLTLPKTEELTRQYWTFLGWSTSKDDTQGRITTYKENSNATLYAIWKENNVNIDYYSYKSIGDYSNTSTTIHLEEQVTISLQNFANTYEFLGWSINNISQPLPYTTTSSDIPNLYNYIEVPNVNSPTTFYGMYRDITPTLFTLSDSNFIRVRELANFDNYIKSPENFQELDETGDGKHVFGFIELSGENLDKLSIDTANITITPNITGLTLRYEKQYNRIFYEIKGDDLSFTTKYTFTFETTDNLGKPVNFTLSIPYNQPIVDIFKSDGSAPAFVDEFRFKVNNHSNAIGTRIASYPRSPITLPHNTITNVCSLEIPRGTWIINIGARFTSNANGYRSACLANNETQNDMNFRIPAVNGQYTQFRWSVVNSFSKPTTVYLNQYQNSNSTLTTGESGINGAEYVDPYYGSFICATRLL